MKPSRMPSIDPTVATVLLSGLLHVECSVELQHLGLFHQFALFNMIVSSKALSSVVLGTIAILEEGTTRLKVFLQAIPRRIIEQLNQVRLRH